MARLLLSFYFVLLTSALHAQDSTLNILSDIKSKLEMIVPAAKSKFKNTANLLLNDPDIYNELWGNVYNAVRDSNKLVFKNLKIKFKTFQGSDSNKTSLGFSYNWDYDINRKKNTDYERSGFSAKLIASGNIAFKQNLNPMNFQQANIVLGRYGFFGGTVNMLDRETVKKLNQLKQKLALIEDKHELAVSPLWNEVTRIMGIKNHYYYDFSLTGGWEGSQDFSKSQVTYGTQIRFSAKSYTDNNALSQFNILDYPFALIRFLTGTDATIKPYGATLPVITTAIEIVKPTHDSARKRLLGNENQFVRFRFEAGFRTLLAEVGNVPIHFNAAYRFYKELNGASEIKTAKLDKFSYFTCSITGDETYFFSYSYGNLPFDRSANAVYEIGFKTNF